MLFRLSHPPLMFEFPNEWWAEAGTADFIPSRESYLSIVDTRESEVILALQEIAPLLRDRNVNRDSNGFRRRGGVDGGPGGMIDVLRAMVNDVPLPPVEVRRIRGTSYEAFGYVLRDGFHRFYASYALRYSHVPCLIGSDWVTEGQFSDEW